MMKNSEYEIIKVTNDELIKFYKSQTFDYDDFDEMSNIKDIVTILEKGSTNQLGSLCSCPPTEFLCGNELCNQVNDVNDSLCQRCWEQILK